ncbi:HAD-IA family hydrolase [Paeniglutamicibacter kerguelensis]|uniref:Sugar-phosphatase n=1 Tax=Paeniglutamicibacter kerguelensis TaxID=254788 RepID=A0ABS4XI53_9MICC|nr:HAD-IA family hydrolase [Paeniglutamicibacter kerguelensis]MBP2388145.1 sugar-phosphatase [Paeniglutamicibacter kerguelensis]
MIPETPPFPALKARALLFDMDGTLVDSTAVVEDLWTDFARQYGIDIGELLEYSHGRQTLDTLRRFLPGSNGDLARLAAELEAQEVTRVDGIIEVPGAGAFLDQLGKIPHAVVTSAGRTLAETRLRAAGLPIPEVLVAAEDVIAGKPSPEGYLQAAAELGVDISACVVFEDAPAGLQSAVNSGATTVVVGTHESPLTKRLSRIENFRGLLYVDGFITVADGH